MRPNNPISIREVTPVFGDWFSVYFHDSRKNYYIERVILWASCADLSRMDHVRGIGCHGIPMQQAGNGDGDQIYVNGRDIAPGGITWSEVYEQATQVSVYQREITHLMPASFPLL